MTEVSVGKKNNCSILLSSSLPVSNRMRKKQLKKTSYERTKEAFEMAREKRRRKKEVMTYIRVITGNDQRCLFFSKMSEGFIDMLIFFVPGVPEKQTAERRSHSEVQKEKDGKLSDPQQKDQERTAQLQPPNGVFASKDRRTWKMNS